MAMFAVHAHAFNVRSCEHVVDLLTKVVVDMLFDESSYWHVKNAANYIQIYKFLVLSVFYTIHARVNVYLQQYFL